MKTVPFETLKNISNTPFMQQYESRSLSASERPKKVYLYAVTGRGAFPIDMLRYDGAWPASEADSRAIGDLWDDNHLRLRTVKIKSHGEPTVARWASFGWLAHQDVWGVEDASRSDREIAAEF